MCIYTDLLEWLLNFLFFYVKVDTGNGNIAGY